MDIGHFVRTAWRFKYTVAIGFVLSLGLAFLAVYHVDYKHGFKLSHRQGQQFQGTATVLVTVPGFPWGRTVSEYIPGDVRTSRPAVNVADTDRLATLTGLYGRLMTSDAIRRQLIGDNDPAAKLDVTAVAAPPYVNPAILPMLNVAGTKPTPGGAVALANGAADRFKAWLERQQRAAKIAPHQRVQIQVIQRARKAVLVGKRSKTLPGVIFLGLMSATFGLVFVRENLNPRARVNPDDEQALELQESAGKAKRLAS